MDSGYRYIVITGFMGTGKSVVGREVARRLGWPFVDMDEMIEKRAGKPIPRIFAEEGERAFREMEAALCQELSKQHDIVVATGGGTLIPPANREILSRHGLVVCLTCDFDELWQRLRDVTNRPMLYAEDRQARLKSLLDERASAYAAIPHQIDTTAIPVTEAAQRVISLWERAYRILPVRTPGGQYFIHLGRGLLAEAGSLLRKAGLSGRAAVVSNPTVAALYADVLEASLQDADFQTARCLVPDGEAYKTLDTVRTLYDAFIEAGLARDSVVLALGGGVIGDAAGFAAATYMRGIPFVQIPTSLLAMVDSSVGGKVAVDHPRGKNLIGAFKQPDLVVADLDVLSTLPAAEYRSGLAEVIKHGIIASPELYACVEEGEAKLSPWALAEAIHVKVEIVEEDPYEQGRRAVLNLGHTFAHALELLSNFTLRHGEAVSIGLVAAARTAEALGLAKEPLSSRIERCLKRHGLPTALPEYALEAIWEAMASDKKRRGGRLRFVLPRAIGDVIVTDQVPRETVLGVLEDMLSERGML